MLVSHLKMHDTNVLWNFWLHHCTVLPVTILFWNVKVDYDPHLQSLWRITHEYTFWRVLEAWVGGKFFKTKPQRQIKKKPTRQPNKKHIWLYIKGQSKCISILWTQETLKFACIFFLSPFSQFFSFTSFLRWCPEKQSYIYKFLSFTKACVRFLLLLKFSLIEIPGFA